MPRLCSDLLRSALLRTTSFLSPLCLLRRERHRLLPTYAVSTLLRSFVLLLARAPCRFGDFNARQLLFSRLSSLSSLAPLRFPIPPPHHLPSAYSFAKLVPSPFPRPRISLANRYFSTAAFPFACTSCVCVISALRFDDIMIYWSACTKVPRAWLLLSVIIDVVISYMVGTLEQKCSKPCNSESFLHWICSRKVTFIKRLLPSRKLTRYIFIRIAFIDLLYFVLVFRRYSLILPAVHSIFSYFSEIKFTDIFDTW